MSLSKKIPAHSAFAGISLAIAFVVLLTTAFAANPNPESGHDLFFPLTPGTWWLYRGTVTWTDQQTDKEAQADVSLKMTIEKVIQKPEVTIAILSGFPRDLDWAAGEVAPMPWLLMETKGHAVFL